MTMFIQLENDSPIGYAVTEDNIRLLFPDKFPVSHVFTPGDVEPLGFGMYEFTQVPTPDYPFKAVEVTPVKREDGIYYQTWDIVELTSDEKLQATINRAETIRGERDYRLFRSDWTQMPDVQLNDEQKAAWLVYRQYLRDVPDQSGFPWNVIWPAQPA